MRHGYSASDTNDLSRSRWRSARAYLASLLWVLIALSALSIVVYVATGGMEAVIAG